MKWWPLSRRRVPDWLKTDLDRRRELEKPESNPGFDLKARRETARLVGVTLPEGDP